MLLKMTADPPPAPPDLPEYVRDGLQARAPAELRAISRWVEALAEHKEATLGRELERPPDDEGDVTATHRYDAETLADQVDEADADFADATGTVYLYWIETHCNKANCSTCPHGPYPYIKYRVGDSVRTRYGKAVASALDVGPPG